MTIVERLRRELAPESRLGHVEYVASVRVEAEHLAALLDVVEAAQAWDMAGYGPGSERADKALIDAIMRLWRLR